LNVYGQRSGKEIGGIEDDALACLKAYAWPGNVRQLENVIERAVVVADKPVITLAELPEDVRQGKAGSGGLSETPRGGLSSGVSDGVGWLAPAAGSVVLAQRRERERRERERVVRALAAAGGNKAEAARALGMARSTLLSRMKRLGLS
jgi:two-component system response regulator AtoC